MPKQINKVLRTIQPNPTPKKEIVVVADPIEPPADIKDKKDKDKKNKDKKDKRKQKHLDKIERIRRSLSGTAR